MGSPRHGKQLAKQAMALTQELGKAHVFITMTFNPKCQEVVEQLLPVQTAFDRPDVVCRIFRAQKNALIHNIWAGKYFSGKAAWLVHVVEYQHRGLPHIHLVCRIENGPDHTNLNTCKIWIGEHISAEMLIIDKNSSGSHLLLHELVS